jgi:hypothetical protein
LVLVCYERRVLLLVAGGWFVLREKYCWLVADKPSEQAESHRRRKALLKSSKSCTPNPPIFFGL